MKSGLLAFILLSALVHAVVISMYEEWIISLSENHEQGSSSINIELLAKTKNTTTPPLITSAIPTPVQVKHSTKALTLTTTKPAPEKIKRIKSQIIKSSPPVIALNTQLTSIQKNSNYNNNKKIDNNEKIKSLLNNELSKYFYYPKAAQRRNRQGKVILAFTINPNGHIENIRINTSSGSNILDNAAINALHKIDAKEELAKALHGNSSEQILPIRYKLTAY